MTRLALVVALGLSSCIYADWRTRDTTDGGAPKEAGPAGCVGIFCESFDDAQFRQRVQLQHSSDQGILELRSASAAPSPPSVLLAGWPKTASGPASSYVTKVLATEPLARASVSASIRVPVHDAEAQVAILGMSFSDGTQDERTVRILFGPKAASVQEKTADRVLQSHAFAPPDLGRFQRLELAVDTAGKVTLHVGDQTVVDDAIDASWKPTRTTRIVAGINFTETPTDPVEVEVDDLRFDGS
jgi:hypothetical protein